MLETVSFTEAKARLSELFDRVENGDEIIVTRHNQPVGRIVPEKRRNQAEISYAVKRLKELRKETKSITIDEITAWKNEGRP
jgi:prevent-host-death family protein